MKLCGRACRPDLLRHFQAMLAAAHRPNARTYNVLLMHARTLDACLELLQDMEARAIAPTTFTYNAVLRVVVERGRRVLVPRFVAEMRRRGVRPDPVTYQLLLRAAATAPSGPEALAQAHALLAEAHAARVRLTPEMFYWLLVAAAGTRQATKVRAAYNGLLGAGMRPRLKCFVLLLRDCAAFLPPRELAFYRADMDRLQLCFTHSL